MPETEKLFNLFSDSLKSMAKGMEKLAEKVEKIGQNLSQEIQAQKPKPQKAEKPAQRQPTATETVLKAIESTKGGADYQTIIAKTGFDRKKITGILYRLKKQGKIKSPEKGIYIKA